MNYRLVIVMLIISLVGLGIYFFPTSHEKNDLPPTSKLDQKYVPDDHFFLQRSYPDNHFDVIAYEKALKQAKQQTLAKNGPVGFDESWTVQGPGNIGARINTVAVDPTDENIMYAGFARGGVFKTTDGGASWQPIFDDQTFLAIGDIVIDPNDNQTEPGQRQPKAGNRFSSRKRQQSPNKNNWQHHLPQV